MAAASAFPTFANVGFLNGRAQHHTLEVTETLSPCFQLLLFLEGEQRFYIDDKLFDIDAGYGNQRYPHVLLLNRTRPCTLRSVASYGENILRKVKVSLPSDWLKRLASQHKSELLSRFADGHMNYCLWKANPTMQALGEAILQPPEDLDPEKMPEATQFFRSAKGLELLAYACADLTTNHSLSQQTGETASSNLSEKTRSYIVEHLESELTIEGLARDLGASKRTVQRSFKDRFGITVSDFIRKQRLERARAALEKQGITVGQAAYLAGYSNISSFSNAFKQLYGDTPKTWRARSS
ncbi:AraC family transcriptional regulator [Labrenzia sp. CE80]|uniref:helix-turn-helix transcriptional regulator n=1 Tax=Labrenzia sp. CE80 TaxID=1788986 RepID=UPI00138940CA|nr:AraC family transcriptional regulator [Labrenzia sp. CE80]